MIATNQLAYLLTTLLKAYRDGYAEVNHVHLEGELNQKPFDLTILFELSAPPMAGEEAARRLKGA